MLARIQRLLLSSLLVASAAATAVAHPGSGIVIDRRGYVYFVDTGSGVWSIDPSGRLMAVAHITGAALSLFRIAADGKLEFARSYDIDVGNRTMWWMGMVALP